MLMPVTSATLSAWH